MRRQGVLWQVWGLHTALLRFTLLPYTCVTEEVPAVTKGHFPARAAVGSPPSSMRALAQWSLPWSHSSTLTMAGELKTAALLLWWSRHGAYKHPAMCCTPETDIVLYVHCNWKIRKEKDGPCQLEQEVLRCTELIRGRLSFSPSPHTFPPACLCFCSLTGHLTFWESGSS